MLGMNKNRNRSLDGFIPNVLGPTQPPSVARPSVALPQGGQPVREFTPPPLLDVSPKSEPNLSQLNMDVSDVPKKKKRKLRLRTKIILWVVAIIIAIGIGGFFYLASKAVTTSQKVFHGGSVLDLLGNGSPLKTDSQGRTNILLFGTSQDDSAHQGASGGGGLWLTDSIELASIDQKAKTVKLVGIPRDLWVALDNCSIGNYAKINAVYECGSGLYNNGTGTPGANYSTQDAKGAQALMTSVQTATGITPQYYVHADYSVLKQAVDAVGGVDVTIKGDGASGIFDTNFDWDCPNGPYTCKNVYYPTDGVYHINGTQALFLARARADGGVYSYEDFGLAMGDFDRQANQQKILTAFKTKATTAGVLANPLTINKLLDALGNNISMNISASEMKTLLSFSKDLPSSAMTQVSLVDAANRAVTTGMVSGQSVVIPTSGALNFSSIISYLNKQLSTNPAVSEGATIAVYNASGVAGKAATEQISLTQLGLTVGNVGNAATKDAGTDTYTLYDLSAGKMPQTLKQLESSLGVQVATTALPADITTTDNFVVVVNK
jgi:anionic cell wall polymer biosynthesis LytR-Cps2A-Psr (LCP) family protein